MNPSSTSKSCPDSYHPLLRGGAWLDANLFNRYISNIEMPGGKIVYVPLHPPASGATETSSASEWKIDFDELERAITPRTKMMVLNTPRK